MRIPDFDLSFAARLAGTIALAGLLGLWFDFEGGLIAFAAFTVGEASASSPPQSRDQHLRELVWFSAALVALVALAWLVADTFWPLALSVGVVTFLAAAAVQLGPHRVSQGLWLNVWFVIALQLVADTPFAPTVVATFIGAGVAIATDLVYMYVWPRTWLSPHEIAAARAPRPSVPLQAATLFAATKAVATSASWLIGYLIVGSRVFWATFVPIVIIMPAGNATATRAVARAIGTVSGGVVGLAIANHIEDQAVLSVVVLVGAFLQGGFIRSSPVIQAFFLTIWIAMVGVLGGGLPHQIVSERIWATFVGIAVSVGLVLAVKAIWLRGDDPDRVGTIQRGG